MALRFCSKWPYSSLHNLINPDIISLFQQTQAELGSSCFFDFDVYDEYVSLSDSSYSIDSLFDTNNINDCKPQNAFPDDSLDEEISRHPKRQKTVSENHCRFTYSSATNTTNPEFSNGYVPIPSFSPEFSNFPSEAILSACWGNQEMIKSEAMKKDSSRSGCCRSATGTTAVSAQSIAARERRRKITEKTQELGKLIPGGNKMNTAEMLQAAYKYVKFLQAQVTVLQLLRSIQEQKEQTLVHIKEVQVILASPSIQEKLYSGEKCLVPKEFVQALAKAHEIQLKPFIEDIKPCLLQINDCYK